MSRLFDEKTLRKLEQLTLIANRVRAGVMKGDRRSTKRGESIEFADYRDYSQGDDIRRIDWNVYARTDKPFIKLFEEEEDLTVHILVDASASMDWPDEPPPHHKFDFARRVGAALAHIGLATGDRVTIGLLRGSGLADRWGPSRGRGRTLPMLQWVEGLSPAGATDLNAALSDYAIRGGRPGLVLVITDMFSPTGYEDGLTALQGRGHEVGLIHVLAPDEIEPTVTGDLRLIDMETGAGQDVTIDASMRGLYARRLREWRDQMAAYTLNRGAHYVAIETSTPWEAVLLYELRRAGILR